MGKVMIFFKDVLRSGSSSAELGMRWACRQVENLEIAYILSYF